MKRFLIACAVVLFGLAPAWGAERTVVYVLFDGFSPAELDAAHPTPHFDELKREGAWSRHLVPAFPSISLINHTTAYTGCWPEHHGIMSNIFVDPKMGRFGDENGDAGDAAWRTGCETMWEAAERQGVRAAAFNTVGRWSSKTGARATYINPEVKWRQHESDDTIIERALKLLKDNGPNHPRFIALYFSIPDSVAHEHGVAGAETQDAVRRADAITGRLMAAIKALPPGREGTLVIGTDHGMMDVGPMINLGRIWAENDIHADQATDGASAYVYVDKQHDSVDRVEFEHARDRRGGARRVGPACVDRRPAQAQARLVKARARGAPSVPRARQAVTPALSGTMPRNGRNAWFVRRCASRRLASGGSGLRPLPASRWRRRCNGWGYRCASNGRRAHDHRHRSAAVARASRGPGGAG